LIDLRQVKIKKLHKDAIIPEYQTKGSSGLDFSSIQNCNIPPGEQVFVDIGLAVEIPEGTELQIRPRSGLSKKFMISITNSPGTIDSDYRGPIGIILINHSKEPFTIQKGDRIAQGVLCPVYKAICIEVEKLSETNRGVGGYGSTGK